MSDEPNLTSAETETEAEASTEDQSLLGGNDGSSVDKSSESDQTTADQGKEAAEGNDADSGDAGEADQTSPESYADFAMPEGIELDAALLEQATPLFKELGLTQEQAQKLVDFQAEQVQAGARSQVDTFNQLKTDWMTQSKSDEEFGGDKFDESIGTARSALDKFGTPELSKLMDDYGIGNHPEVIRFMVRVGKLTQEDVPGGTPNNTSPEQDRISLLYPNNKSA